MTTNYIGAATGTIEVVGDSDWFGIQLTAGTEYLFNVGNGTLTDPSVSIYNSSGTLLSSASGGGAGGSFNNNSQIAFTATTSGTYYVGASSQSGQQTGTYAIQAYTATPDFAGNTSTTGALTIGGNVSGNLTAAGQSDWFKVTLTAGTEYVFNVNSGTLTNGQNQLVTLYDSNGNYLLSGGDFEQVSGAQIAYIPTASGTFYVGVSGNSGATGSFTLTSSTPTFDFGDTIATAGSVTVGVQTSGNLTQAQQRDWFHVTLTAGTQYTLSVGGGTLGTNATVALYDGSGNTLIQQISGGGLNGAEESFTPTTSGVYYVEAGGLFGATGTFNVSIGTYTGTALPNVNTNGAIAAGSQVSGQLMTPGDSNWFKATLTAGKDYSFTLTQGSLTQGVVTVYNSAGVEVAQSSGVTSGGVAQITFAPTATGTFYIGAGAATLQTGTYTLSANTITPDHFGNINTNGSIAIGSAATGNIANIGQSDWFKTSLASGGHYVFDASGALTNPEVSIYDGNGNLLAQGSSEISLAPVNGGTFYIGVGSSGTGTGAFTLSANNYTDDYPAGITTKGGFTSAAGEVANYQAGLLTTANSISDSIANVMANLSGLEQVAAAGKLTAIHFTDIGIPTLSLNATQVLADAKAVEAIAVAGYQLSVADTAANVSSALDVLQTLATNGVNTSINLTDAGSPVLTITSAQLASDSLAISDIAGNFDPVIGNATAANANTLLANSLVDGVIVVDSALNVLANLNSLESAATTPAKTLSIHLTDPGIPSLIVSESQFNADVDALGTISGSYAVTVNSVLAGDAAQVAASNSHVVSMNVVDSGDQVNANLDALNSLATSGKLSSVTLTDPGFVTFSVTPTQLANDTTILNMLNGYFTTSIDASAANLTINGLANHGNTVVFSNDSGKYSYTPSGNGVSLTVTDVGTGRVSTDNLSNVTALQFGDGTYIVAQTPSATSVTTGNVTELYGAVFGRLPDVPGLAYYEQVAAANPSFSLTVYAQWFLASPEYVNNPAHSYAANATGDAQFITDSYNNLLGRAPEAGAVAWYQANVINAIIGNLTPGTAAYQAADTLAHAYVLTDFSQSAEFLGDVSATPGQPLTPQHWLILI